MNAANGSQPAEALRGAMSNLIEALIVRKASSAFPGVIGIRRVPSPAGIAIYELQRVQRLRPLWAAVDRRNRIVVWEEPPRL